MPLDAASEDQTVVIVKNGREYIARALTIAGLSLPITEWAQRSPARVPDDVIRGRLRLGWTPQEAVFLPVGEKRRSTARVERLIAEGRAFAPICAPVVMGEGG